MERVRAVNLKRNFKKGERAPQHCYYGCGNPYLPPEVGPGRRQMCGFQNNERFGCCMIPVVTYRGPLLPRSRQLDLTKTVPGSGRGGVIGCSGVLLECCLHFGSRFAFSEKPETDQSQIGLSQTAAWQEILLFVRKREEKAGSIINGWKNALTSPVLFYKKG